METIFHLYLPTNFFQNKEIRKCVPQNLVGCIEIETPQNKNTDTSSFNIVKVVVIGLHSQNKNNDSKLSGYNELIYVGDVKYSDPKFGEEQISERKSNTIWISFKFSSKTLQPTNIQISYKGLEIPLGNILIITFDPVVVYRFIKSNGLTRNQGIFSPPLASSFSKVTPDTQNEFVRLLPFRENLVIGDLNKVKDSSPSSDLTRHHPGDWLRIMERSIGMKQIRHKFYTVLKIVQYELPWITMANLLFVLMIDAFFGTLVSSYLSKFPNLYSLILGRVEALLQVLLQLITWLGGSPAGLKLNAALNSLMGRFFSYHLHLWRNYIGILEPLLSFILAALINVGFCGLTLQIALAKDLLSIATFHIYCLYIYATRLFNVELNLLKSLGRLFFGRKWNPLRNRIDSIHLSNSEMFLSSMGFTISVFLAPTAILYYMVFLSLRLPCLIVESILSYLVEVVNSMEPVTCIFILTNSSWVADKIYIKPVKLFDLTGAQSEIQCYEIRTRTSRELFKTPNLGKPIVEVICKIIQSKVITQ